MNKRIEELKELHKLSKPELAIAIMKVKGHMDKPNIDLLTQMVFTGLLGACESYDSVIDELFAEIERLEAEVSKARDVGFTQGVDYAAGLIEGGEDE